MTSDNVLELNGRSDKYPETIYQSVPVLPGSTVTISFWYTQRTKGEEWGTQSMLLSVVPAKYNDGTADVATDSLTRTMFSDNALPGSSGTLKIESGNASISESTITAGTEWSRITGTYKVPGNVYEVYVGFHGVSPTKGGGNILAGASVKTALLNDVYVSFTGSDTTGGGTKDAPFATLEQAFSWVADGGTVHVMNDLTLEDAGVTFSESKAVTVLSDSDGDLSDDEAYSIQRGSAFAAPMLAVSDGSLTLKALTLDGQKETYDSFNVTGTSTGINVTGGTLTLGKGFVLQNSYNEAGNYASAGLRICGADASASLEDGAKIRNNTSYDGPGVMVRTGTFTMNGGTISGNYSIGYGSGVYLSGSNSANTAVAYLNGGTITNNYVSTANSGGGGLMVHNNSTAVLNGVTIKGNGVCANSAEYAAGVYLYGTTNSNLTVAGDTVISGNTGGATFTESNNTVAAGSYASNVYLAEGRTITIGDEHLGRNARIGVYTETTPTDTKDVQIATNANVSDRAYFMSDNATEAGVLYCSGSADSPREGHHSSSHAAKTLWLSTAAAEGDMKIDLTKEETNTQQKDNEYIYQLGNASVTGKNGRTFEISVDSGYFTVDTDALPENAAFYSSLDVGGAIGTDLSTSAQYTYLSLRTNGTTADDLQTFLQNDITFHAPGATEADVEQTVTVVAENADIPEGTEAFQGHYYQFVENCDIKWSDAYGAAKASKYNGLTGYLITVTSKQEHEYIYKKFGKNGWMGASRAIATNGYDKETYTYSGNETSYDWYWVCGPEAGTSFGTQSVSGGFATKSDAYSNWKAGEPNGKNLPGTANEGFGQYGYGSGGLWNDLRNQGGGCGYIQGYYVEYGGYETDSDSLTVAPASDSKTIGGKTEETAGTAVDPKVKNAARTADTITIPAGSSDTARDYAVMDSKGNIIGWQTGTGVNGVALVFTGLDPEETYTVLESVAQTGTGETGAEHKYTTDGAQVLLPVPSTEQVMAGDTEIDADGKTTTSIVISPAAKGLLYQAVSVDEEGNETVVGKGIESEEEILDADGNVIGTITTVTISGLDPGKEYTIQVVDSSGKVTTDGPTILGPVAPVDSKEIKRETESSGPTDIITVSNTKTNQVYALVDENGNYIKNDGTLNTEKDEAGNDINVPYWVSPDEAGATLTWSGLDTYTTYRVLTADKSDAGDSPVDDAIPAETVVSYSCQAEGSIDAVTGKGCVKIGPLSEDGNYQIMSASNINWSSVTVTDANGNIVAVDKDGKITGTAGEILNVTGLTPGCDIVFMKLDDESGEEILTASTTIPAIHSDQIKPDYDSEAKTASITIDPAVSGVNYAIVDAEGKLVADSKMGTGGALTFEGLEPGKEYQVVVLENAEKAGEDAGNQAMKSAVSIVTPDASVDDAQQQVKKCMEDLEAAAKDVQVTNETTKEELLQALTDLLGELGYADAKLSFEEDSFEKDNATETAAGKIKVRVKLTLDGKSVTQEMEFEIGQLEAVEPAVNSDQLTVGYDSETNTTSITIDPTVSGANYAIVDAEGNLVADSKVGTGGTLTFEGLEPGKEYQVVVLESEKKAGENAGDQAMKSAVSIVTPDAPMDDAQEKVQECRTALEAAVKEITVTNDTTEDALLKALRSLLDKLGYSDVDISSGDFTKTNATGTAAGKISAAVTLTYNGKTITLPLNFTIGQISMNEVESDTASEVAAPSESTQKQVEKQKDLGLLLAEGAGVKKKVRISWKKYDGAEKYEVYWNRCNGSKKYRKLTTTKKLTAVHKKLSAKKCYKYYVKAYQMTSGKKVYVARSPVIHVAMKHCKRTNVKKIRVSRKKISLARGKTHKLSVSAIAVNKKKKLVKHAAKFRYYTASEKVATVNKKGKVSARGKGTCCIYVVANNGRYKKIKVNVR